MKDLASDIFQTSDGGYIFGASSTSQDGTFNANYGKADFWVVKLDQDGEIEWKKRFGGSQDDFFLTLKPTMDGGYIVGGRTKSKDFDLAKNYGNDDAWVVKLDQNGGIVWSKTYGGSGRDFVSEIVQSKEGGYIRIA